MKKILAFLVLLLFVGCFVAAQNVYQLAEAEITWDPVATFSDGSPIPATDQVSYEVLAARPGTHEAPVSLWVSAGTSYRVALPGAGDWAVGVRALHKAAGSADTSAGEINWSDVAGNGKPETFILRLTRYPGVPQRLRVP